MDRHIKALSILKEGTIIPAIPLVLDSNRQFDASKQQRLVRYYLEAGVGGVAAAVHTTQFEIRDSRYQLLAPVLQTVISEIDRYENESGKTLVRIAGVCGNIKQACSEAELAKQLGYDAVLLSPGGLNHLSEAEMLERTRQVASIMPVIGFYLQSSVGGRRFSFEYWKQLSDIPNVVAIKSAPFNRYQTLDLVRGCASSARRDEVALYTGNDDNIIIDLLTPYTFQIEGEIITKRFVGGLLGHWSVWTHNAVDIFHKIKQYQERDTIPASLLTLAAQVTDANGAFFDVAHEFKGCIAGIHEVLHRQELMENIYCLNPDETLSAGQKEEIDRVYQMYPHLNDDSFIKDYLKKLSK